MHNSEVLYKWKLIKISLLFNSIIKYLDASNSETLNFLELNGILASNSWTLNFLELNS